MGSEPSKLIRRICATPSLSEAKAIWPTPPPTGVAPGVGSDPGDVLVEPGDNEGTTNTWAAVADGDAAGAAVSEGAPAEPVPPMVVDTAGIRRRVPNNAKMPRMATRSSGQYLRRWAGVSARIVSPLALPAGMVETGADGLSA